MCTWYNSFRKSPNWTMLSCAKQKTKEMCALYNLHRCSGAYPENRPAGLSLLSFLTSAAILLLTLSYLPKKGHALEITNQKSGRNVEAAGTGAFFVPAAGLTLADAFDGFESKERNIQVIVANFGAPLDEIAKGFTEETFKAMGMELKSRGEFTVNGARAFLFKVLHPNGDINWGKWIMLAGNGNNTLEVNAVFVSGDAEAASDLETMLKGVYMEPPRPVSASADAAPAGEISVPPVSEDISETPLSEDIRADETSVQPAAESRDVIAPEGAISRDVRPENETKPAALDTDSTEPDEIISADLTKPVSADEEVRPDRETVSDDVPVSPDTDGWDDAVSPDKSVRKTGVRIITEKGIVSVEDAQTGTPAGENGYGE